MIRKWFCNFSLAIILPAIQRLPLECLANKIKIFASCRHFDTEPNPKVPPGAEKERSVRRRNISRRLTFNTAEEKWITNLARTKSSKWVSSRSKGTRKSISRVDTPQIKFRFLSLFQSWVDDVMTYPKVTSSHGPDGCSVTVARIKRDHSLVGLGLLSRIINVNFHKDESALGRSQFSK